MYILYICYIFVSEIKTITMNTLIKTEAKRILSLKKITHLEYNFCVLNRVEGFSNYNYEWSVNDCKYIKIK